MKRRERDLTLVLTGSLWPLGGDLQGQGWKQQEVWWGADAVIQKKYDGGLARTVPAREAGERQSVSEFIFKSRDERIC